MSSNLRQHNLSFILCRSCRGRHVSLFVRFPSHGRQGEDFEIWSHTNESVASVRRQIISRYFCIAIYLPINIHLDAIYLKLLRFEPVVHIFCQI